MCFRALFSSKPKTFLNTSTTYDMRLTGSFNTTTRQTPSSWSAISVRSAGAGLVLVWATIDGSKFRFCLGHRTRDASLGVRERNFYHIFLRTPLQLHDTFLESFASDGKAQWNPDQIGILELHARTFRAVIDEHIGARLLGRSRDFLRELHGLGQLGIEDANQHVKRSYVPWPDDAVGIVALLDHRLHRAA